MKIDIEIKGNFEPISKNQFKIIQKYAAIIQDETNLIVAIKYFNVK